MEIVCLPRKSLTLRENLGKYRDLVYVQPPRGVVKPKKLCKPVLAKMDSETTYDTSYPSPGFLPSRSLKLREVKRFGSFDFDTTTQAAYTWPQKSRSEIIHPRGRLGFAKNSMASTTTQKDSYTHPGEVKRTQSLKKFGKCPVTVPMESATTYCNHFVLYDMAEASRRKPFGRRRKCAINFKPEYITNYQENFMNIDSQSSRTIIHKKKN
uniref:Fam154a protein n=1 Tax=Fopius arisanus TaxID=64838 RepID=A0A0C9RLR5_9HYME